MLWVCHGLSSTGSPIKQQVITALFLLAMPCCSSSVAVDSRTPMTGTTTTFLRVCKSSSTVILEDPFPEMFFFLFFWENLQDPPRIAGCNQGILVDRLIHSLVVLSTGSVVPSAGF